MGAEKTEEQLADDKEEVPKFWSLSSGRFRIALLLCFGYFGTGLLKMNISMAIVCMVNNTGLDQATGDQSINISTNSGNGSDVVIKSGPCTLNSAEKAEYEGPFLWDSYDQKDIFAAYFWGAFFAGMFGGWFADRHGPKIVYLTTALVGIIGSASAETLAKTTGVLGMSTMRFFTGFVYGVQFSCCGATLAKWCPPNERSTVIAIFTGGTSLAALFGMPFFAWLCSLDFLDGWPLIFYTSALIPAIWVILWCIFFTNSPEENYFISTAEKRYIEESLQATKSTKSRKEITNETPWLKIVSSLPVISICAAGFGGSLMNGTFQSYMPTYFKDVLKTDLKKNGLFTSFPFLCQLTGKLGFSVISDKMKAESKLSYTAVCKIFTSISSFGCAVLLVGLSYVDCLHAWAGVTLACSLYICYGAAPSGFRTMLLSVAPPYSGTVSSIVKLFMDAGMILSPQIVGYIATEGTQDQWQLIFWILAAVLVVAGMIILIFGSADMQPWAIIKDDKQTEDAKEDNHTKDTKPSR